MVIPESELEDKRRRVRDGQAHRKHRVDLADRRPAKEQEQASSYRPAQAAQEGQPRYTTHRRHRLTVSMPHSRRRAAAVCVSPPQGLDRLDRPTLAELHRCVCTGTAESTDASGAPPTTS